MFNSSRAIVHSRLFELRCFSFRTLAVQICQMFPVDWTTKGLNRDILLTIQCFLLFGKLNMLIRVKTKFNKYRLVQNTTDNIENTEEKLWLSKQCTNARIRLRGN